MTAPNLATEGPTTEPAVRQGPLLTQASGLALLLIGVVLAGQRWISPQLEGESFRTWCTMFVAAVVQSVPFLPGGVVLSAVVSRFLSDRALRRVVPRHPVLAVPAAGLAGFGLPGCECAAIPVAEGPMRRGVPESAALTFLLPAPAINPAVVVATAVAFAGDVGVVAARIAASLLTAVAVGWWCLWRGDRLNLTRRNAEHHHDAGLVAGLRHDFVYAGGFLVIGAMAAAAVNTSVPREILDTVAGQAILGVAVMAVFAFVAALCSESDAFVAASLTSFSDTAKLTFLVVGPAMDIKLAAMESGQFGWGFARQFVPVVLCVAVTCTAVTGTVLM